MNHIHYNLILGSDVLRGSDIRVDKIVTGRKHLDHVYGYLFQLKTHVLMCPWENLPTDISISFLAAEDCNLKVELEKTHWCVVNVNRAINTYPINCLSN